jgi:hypothetical protein
MLLSMAIDYRTVKFRIRRTSRWNDRMQTKMLWWLAALSLAGTARAAGATHARRATNARRW